MCDGRGTPTGDRFSSMTILRNYASILQNKRKSNILTQTSSMSSSPCDVTLCSPSPSRTSIRDRFYFMAFAKPLNPVNMEDNWKWFETNFSGGIVHEALSIVYHRRILSHPHPSSSSRSCRRWTAAGASRSAASWRVGTSCNSLPVFSHLVTVLFFL